MSIAAQERSREFLKTSGDFRLGALVTEAAHPVTTDLGEVAKSDLAAALDLLFRVDGDVVKKFSEFAASGRAETMAGAVLAAVNNGGRIFFTGCGATGRLGILLDSIWRDFWRQRKNPDWENRTFSVMAGGDCALIKSVEGFEDFTAFGGKQMTDLGVTAKDVVLAITEGGETSFVIGTAWASVAAGAKVYFIYNNSDAILCEHVPRSRAVIQDPRIEKLNLTTGPMAITGSTRMQAVSIQLCVLLTVLEIVVQELAGGTSAGVALKFLAGLEELHANLRSSKFLSALAALAALEEATYRGGHKSSYFAGGFGIDVLTDTAERSPTFGTPPFRKFDDDKSAESWAFLFVPADWTDNAWQSILQRKPRCVEWSEPEIRALVAADKVDATLATVARISSTELMRYKIGSNGIKYRPLVVKDTAIAIVAATETDACRKFQARQLEMAQQNLARTGVIYFGGGKVDDLFSVAEVKVFVFVPATDFLLDGLTRVAVKLVLNALSTATMARLDRVAGNCMTCVVPGNRKLIDRATRYVAQLAGLGYELANALLFEVIEYLEPRWQAGQACPPVVNLAVLRAREKLSNEQAEEKFKAGLQ